MQDENLLYWIWLSLACGVASRDYPRLMERYETPFDVYRAESEELEGAKEIGRALRDALCDKSLERAYSILRYCKKQKIDILCPTDKRYPSRLRSLEDPPVVLYVMGKLPDLDRRLCIGVVGTRNVSEYGIESSYKISYELSAAGACIVSGMALGVDGIAACGALEAGGNTVAVLGSGVDVIYPRVHKSLYRAIAAGGAVISEYAPGEAPLGFHFPKRNRLISGLSQGVLVVEGNLKSGAMITAKTAMDQGREVFALPGKINESNSEGPNELIRKGANVALGSDDILLHYDFLYHDVIDYRSFRKSKQGSALSEGILERYGVSSPKTWFPKQEKKVEETVAREVASPLKQKTVSAAPDSSEEKLMGLDELTRRVFALLPMEKAVTADSFLQEGIGIGDAVTSLTLLEIAGLVESLPGGLYIRK